MTFYKDTLPRKEGFERLIDLTRLSRFKYQSRIYLEGTTEIEEALRKPEIHFWLQAEDRAEDTFLELFEMTRLSIRRCHRNPRCVISVMVLGKVENLARMATVNLQEFVGDNPTIIVVFENVELFLTRMRLRKAKKDEGAPARPLFLSIKKEDGSDFPIVWPVEKRLWELRVRENALEEYALNNKPLEDSCGRVIQEGSFNDNNNSVVNENQNNAAAGGDPWVRENLEFLLQEEFNDAYGFSRWVPVQDLMDLHAARVAGRVPNISSPSTVRYPVPGPALEIRIANKAGHRLRGLGTKRESESCPWCPIAVGGICFRHSLSNGP